MESNPYAAPAAVVDDVRGQIDGDLESRKTSRVKRLGAFLLNGVSNLVWIVPIILSFAMSGGIQEGIKSARPALAVMVLGFILLVGMLVINGVLIHRHGQTIGKRMLDIAMVRSDGDRMGLTRYIFLRALPIGLLGLIPFVGKFAGLVNVLLIFGAQRRCLHDLIADTIVVDV